MRLAACELEPVVTVNPGTARPIRLRHGTIRFMLTETEALALADQLADAVEKLNNQGRNTL